MSNLIITILAIALAGVASVMGGMYVNTNVFKTKNYKHSAETGFLKLKVAHDMYLSYRGERPTTGDVSPADGVPDWKAQLNSLRDGETVPRPLKGGHDWSYNIVGSRYNFCLTGSYDEGVYDGFVAAAKDIQKADVFVTNGNSCSATTNATEAVIATDGTISMVYWLSR